MEKYLDKFKVEIDYENQPFEKMENNPYEIVIATAKYARKLNEKLRKYFGSDCDIQPRNLAVKKLESENLRLRYENENEKDDEKNDVPDRKK